VVTFFHFRCRVKFYYLLTYLLISSVEEMQLATFAIASYNLCITLTNVMFKTIFHVNEYSFLRQKHNGV